MDYYCDITILIDPEFSPVSLMNALYTKLHKILFDLKSKNIGVSFPQYSTTLGNILRLHGKKSDLEKLFEVDWIGSMRSFCIISSIQNVPKNVKFRTVSRKQITVSQSKLRRLIKRGSIQENEIYIYNEKIESTKINGPYLDLISGSNGHKHRRYIVLGELIDCPRIGDFDQFGLSKIGTIPWF